MGAWSKCRRPVLRIGPGSEREKEGPGEGACPVEHARRVKLEEMRQGVKAFAGVRRVQLEVKMAKDS